jgi:hypothetical protein
MKAAAIVAGAMGVVAALVVAAEDWVFSAFFGLPALALLMALFRGWWRVQVAAQLVLIVELIIVGAIWPSQATIGALIALPSFVLGIIYLIKGRSPRWGEIYLLVSTLLASGLLLLQAYALATLQH